MFNEFVLETEVIFVCRLRAHEIIPGTSTSTPLESNVGIKYGLQTGIKSRTKIGVVNSIVVGWGSRNHTAVAAALL